MKEPVVFLPGMMCDGRLFRHQIDAFSREYPVMVAPLVGHDTFRELAGALLRHLPERFALAGLSMGGIVAMELVRQAPDRITRLALMDTNPLAERPEVASNRDRQMAKVLAGGLTAVMRDELKPNYLADARDKTAILELCVAMAEALGPDVFVQQSRALRVRPDQCDTLRQVNVPTLVLCGRHDTLCPPERHELMRDLIPGSRLTIIENAGHLPVLEQADATTKALHTWLTRPYPGNC